MGLGIHFPVTDINANDIFKPFKNRTCKNYNLAFRIIGIILIVDQNQLLNRKVFIKKTTIQYTIPEQGKVRLVVYDMLGNPITELVNETQTAGSYKVQFEDSMLNAGVYLYKIEVEGKTRHFSGVKNMVITK